MPVFLFSLCTVQLHVIWYNQVQTEYRDALVCYCGVHCQCQPGYQDYSVFAAELLEELFVLGCCMLCVLLVNDAHSGGVLKENPVNYGSVTCNNNWDCLCLCKLTKMALVQCLHSFHSWRARTELQQHIHIVVATM